MNGQEKFSKYMQESIVVIRFICDGIEIIGTWEYTWTDHFLNTPSLSLMIFHAASDMLQFILASSILCQSTKFSWNMFGITNQDTARTFYIAFYAYAILNIHLHKYKECRGAPWINDTTYMCTCEYTYFENEYKTEYNWHCFYVLCSLITNIGYRNTFVVIK